MTIAEHDPNIAGLKREWLAARVFAYLAVPILVTAVVASLLLPSNSLPFLTTDTVSPASQRRAADIALCSAVVSITKGFGIVPNFTQLASAGLEEETSRGRYSCLARTGAATYLITFDLICTNLADTKCISLYRVVQDGSGAIYQRK